MLRANVEGEVVRRTEGHQDVTLTGSEAALFRGVAGAEDVKWLAADYGWLGLGNAAREIHPGEPEEWPLWYRLLTLDPRKGAYLAREPVADWVRQGGLLDIAWGMLGLLRHPVARKALRTVRPTAVASIQEDHEQYAKRWAVVSIRDGARRAGLRVRVDGDKVRIIEGPGWKRPGWLPHGGPALRFVLTTEGIETAFRDLVNPWLRRLPPVLVADEGGRSTTGFEHPGDLIGALWVEMVNALLSEVKPRVCAWEGCPGPPKRPRVFVWRWSTREKRRSAEFCHARCKAADAQAKSRRRRKEYERKHAEVKGRGER